MVIYFRIRYISMKEGLDMAEFKLVSEFEPTGDQPQAIEKLVQGFREGNQFQTLLGVTGSGKTFTMANVIAQVKKPTLIIAHNKTLAAQLYGEFKEFFPENAVEYFVSYYDYYQPEAYVPSTDTTVDDTTDETVTDDTAEETEEETDVESEETVENVVDTPVADGDYKKTKYTSDDNSIVSVTYEGGITFLLNYNDFDVTVVYDSLTYTISGFGYVVIK